MTKIIRKMFLFCLGFITLFLSINDVKANSVNKIEMEVYINSNGDVTITEIWDAYLNQGTEGYRPYTSLGNSEISNFSVTDETGITYKFLPNWNTNANFEQKAYKNGIHNIDDGVELCWGISKYGNKKYTLKYNISNFVTQYTDTQGIYFNFINLEQPVGSAKITIHSDIKLTLDNAKIWGFGNNGTTTFEDGKIILNSKDGLSTNQYMVILVRFESNLFNTKNTSAKSFDDIYNLAMTGIEKNNIDDNTIDNGFLTSFNNMNIFLKIILAIIALILAPIFFILAILLNPIVLIIFVIFFRKTRKNIEWKTVSNNLDYGEVGKKLPADDKIDYWREIPCDRDLAKAYWVAFQYDVVSANTLRECIIGSFLLKWIKDGQITVVKTRKGLLDFKDNNYAIDFSKMINANTEIENKLLNMLKKAAGINGGLEAKEFERWCEKNFEQIEYWYNEINHLSQIALESQGLITTINEETTGMFNRKKIIKTKKVSHQLREEAIHLKGLKKFLLDFSMMPEKEYFEVHIWEEYLMFAQLLGIADKVEEQFSELYPNFKQQTNLNIEITTMAIRNMASIGYSGYQTGRRSSQLRSHSSNSNSKNYSGTSRSSGGGGRSYSSGGSSSRGSSGGGFR